MLDHHLIGHRGRTGMSRIGHRDKSEEAGIGQIAPAMLGRRRRHFQGAIYIGIVADAETRQAHADPLRRRRAIRGSGLVVESHAGQRRLRKRLFKFLLNFRREVDRLKNAARLDFLQFLIEKEIPAAPDNRNPGGKIRVGSIVIGGFELPFDVVAAARR